MYWGMQCLVNMHDMTPGSDEAELEMQDVTDSCEDVKDSSINKQPQASEEDPERNKVSTIHTAHRYLMDPTVQV